jgi:hypothetical protein
MKKGRYNGRTAKDDEENKGEKREHKTQLVK